MNNSGDAGIIIIIMMERSGEVVSQAIIIVKHVCRSGEQSEHLEIGTVQKHEKKKERCNVMACFPRVHGYFGANLNMKAEKSLKLTSKSFYIEAPYCNLFLYDVPQEWMNIMTMIK